MQGWLSNFVSFRSKFGSGRGVFSGSNRPLRRRFLRYEIEVTEGRLWLVDHFEECDRRTGQYCPGEFRTAIDTDHLGQLAERLLIDAELRQDLARRLSELRHEVDRAGLKIFFDRQQDGGLQPKWRYRLHGRWVTELIRIGDETVTDPYNGDPDLMPAELPSLAASDQNYYQTEVWQTWFGRKMQRKRETVILGAVLDLLPEPM